MAVATSLEDLRLDDIVFDPDPLSRTQTLEAWVALEQVADEPVLLQAVDGKTGKNINKTITFRGKTYNFNNKGKGVQRRLAIALLLAFGREGKYRKKHRETGISQMVQMRELLPEQREAWQARGGIKIEDWYLTHIVKPHDDEDIAPAA